MTRSQESLAWALFDLDGCLIDSNRTIPACINAGLAAVGLPEQDPTSLRWCIGPPLAGSFERLLVEGGHADPAGALAVALDGYRAAFPDLSVELTTIVEGVEDLLARVPQQCAVVTSKPAEAARPLVAALGLDGYVEAVYGPGADVEDEAKATTLARALDDLAVADASTAVMIGDRHHDVEAGHANGTATVGVTWGAGDRQELLDAGADHVLDRVEDLEDLLVTGAGAPTSA